MVCWPSRRLWPHPPDLTCTAAVLHTLNNAIQAAVLHVPLVCERQQNTHSTVTTPRNYPFTVITKCCIVYIMLYCHGLTTAIHSMFYCLPDIQFQWVQSVHNATGWLVTGTWQAMWVFRDLHWLSVWQHVDFTPVSRLLYSTRFFI